jgi:hypothetical protein
MTPKVHARQSASTLRQDIIAFGIKSFSKENFTLRQSKDFVWANQNGCGGEPLPTI